MRNLSPGVIAAGLAGLVGSFLPLSHDLSWWARRDGPDGVSVFFVIGAYAVAAGVGGVGMKRGLERWIALVALIGFTFVALKLRRGFFELFTGQLGGQLMGVGAAAGILLAGLGAWRPSDRGGVAGAVKQAGAAG